MNGSHWNWIWFHLESDMVSQLDLDLVFSLDSEMFFIGIGFSWDWSVFHRTGYGFHLIWIWPHRKLELGFS